MADQVERPPAGPDGEATWVNRLLKFLNDLEHTVVHAGLRLLGILTFFVFFALAVWKLYAMVTTAAAPLP